MTTRHNAWIVAAILLAVSTAQGATIFVDAANCSGPGDGSELDPYCSIQTAIDNAVDTDEIVVAPGTYFETINFIGKAITLRSSDGPDVTIIDAQRVGTVVTCGSSEGPDTVLEGFTITRGSSSSDGGGMLISGASPTVVDCTFLNNSAADLGGGMRILADSHPTLHRCSFIGNVADTTGGLVIHDGSLTLIDCAFVANGGGMAGFFSDLSLTRCVFADNEISLGGGGLAAGFGTLTLVDCVFVGNDGGFDGGGVLEANDSTLILNCLFSGNSSGFGAGLASATNDLAIVNCTFVGNSNDGLYFGGDVSPLISNCVFWDNDGAQFRGTGPPPFVRYSDIQGGWPGMGNIDQNPLFVAGPDGTWTAFAVFDDVNHQTMFTDANASYDPGELVGEVITPFTLLGTTYQTVVAANSATTISVYGDWSFVVKGATYRIDEFGPGPGSPCIDAGNNAAVPQGVLRDLDGNTRFVADACAGDSGATVDMGAYEFQGTSCDLGTMLEMLAAWGRCNDCGTCPADFDCDCSVGILDVLILLGNWG